MFEADAVGLMRDLKEHTPTINDLFNVSPNTKNIV